MHEALSFSQPINPHKLTLSNLLIDFMIKFGERQYIEMSMEAELILVAGLIIIFIASFCGLLQKIRKTYENEAQLTGRPTNVSSPRISLTEVYVNPSFSPGTNNNNEDSLSNEGIFPGTPPPYTEVYCEPPPTYEEIIKDQNFRPPVQDSTV